MGKLTCPPLQFRFAEEGEKGNYAASGRQQESRGSFGKTVLSQGK